MRPERVVRAVRAERVKFEVQHSSPALHGYRVHDARTKKPYQGEPSAELVRRSMAMGGEGPLHVQAYQDGAGVWRYAANDPDSAQRFQGLELVNVYVQK